MEIPRAKNRRMTHLQIADASVSVQSYGPLTTTNIVVDAEIVAVIKSAIALKHSSKILSGRLSFLNLQVISYVTD